MISLFALNPVLFKYHIASHEVKYWPAMLTIFTPDFFHFIQWKMYFFFVLLLFVVVAVSMTLKINVELVHYTFNFNV